MFQPEIVSTSIKNDSQRTTDETTENLTTNALSLLREFKPASIEKATSDALTAGLPSLTIEGLGETPAERARRAVLGLEDSNSPDKPRVKPEQRWQPGPPDNPLNRPVPGEVLPPAGAQPPEPGAQPPEQPGSPPPEQPIVRPPDRPIRIDNPPANVEYGPDGNIIGGTETLRDGSTRQVRYRPPAEINGEMRIVPLEETITRPGFATTRRYFNPEGEVQIIDETTFNGFVSHYTRRDDGTYAGTTVNDGYFSTGIYNANLTPRHEEISYRSGERIVTDYDGNGGSVRVHTRRDGTVTTTWRDRDSERNRTQHVDGTVSTQERRADGSSIFQRTSRSGQLIQNIVLPAELGENYVVTNRPDGGIDLHFGTLTPDIRENPDGTRSIRVGREHAHRSRTVEIGPMGQVLGETSYYPDGSRRESIRYNHQDRTRNVSRFNADGSVRSRVSGEPLPSRPVVYN